MVELLGKRLGHNETSAKEAFIVFALIATVNTILTIGCGCILNAFFERVTVFASCDLSNLLIKGNGLFA
jgi:hypothetical protein